MPGAFLAADPITAIRVNHGSSTYFGGL